MPGIYAAALIATAVALAGGAWLLRSAPAALRVPLALMLLLQLPIEPLSFVVLRNPLDALVRQWVDPQGPEYGLLRTIYAPLTEETAKLSPLLLPWFSRRFDRRDTVWWALAMGLGFGVGEIWQVASLVVSGNPEVARLPWFLLGGFITERLLVCVAHSSFAAATLLLLRRWGIAAILAGMGLHFVGNFPIYLAANNVGALGRPAWTVILTIWLQVFCLVMIAFLAWVHCAAAGLSLSKMMNFARCPACGLEYRRPLAGVNFPTGRYETCPHCGGWHFAKWLWEPASPRAGAQQQHSP